MKNRGYTLAEVIITVVILMLLFGSANAVLSYSRKQTEKGFWIQQALGQLRNATRFISDRMKQTTYPSAKILEGDKIKTLSFKEKRIYQYGHLASITINASEEFDMHTLKSGSTTVVPNNTEQEVMHFPVCTPDESNLDGGNKGKITWFYFYVRPGSDFEYSGLGELCCREYTVEYNLNKSGGKFNIDDLDKDNNNLFKKEGVGEVKDRVLVKDVGNVVVENYVISSAKGFAVNRSQAQRIGKKGGKTVRDRRKENAKAMEDSSTEQRQVSVTINCHNSKDGKITLYDQCCVVCRVLVQTDIEAEPALIYHGLNTNGDKAVVSFKTSKGEFGVGEVLPDGKSTLKSFTEDMISFEDENKKLGFRPISSEI